MATTFSVPERFANSVIFTYPALGNENGDAIEASAYPDKTVCVYGTGTVAVQGSADGAHWAALKDQSGTVISLVVAASAAAAYILENTRYLRVVNNNATGVIASIVCTR